MRKQRIANQLGFVTDVLVEFAVLAAVSALTGSAIVAVFGTVSLPRTTIISAWRGGPVAIFDLFIREGVFWWLSVTAVILAFAAYRGMRRTVNSQEQEEAARD